LPHLLSSLLLGRLAALRHIAPPFIPDLLQKLPLRHLFRLHVFLHVSVRLLDRSGAVLVFPNLFDTLPDFRYALHCPLLLQNQPVDPILRAGRTAAQSAWLLSQGIEASDISSRFEALV
jgi:hypothetical protein